MNTKRVSLNTPAVRELRLDEIECVSGGASVKTTGWVDPDTQPVRPTKPLGWVDPEPQPIR
jgi:hypothetical protein